VKIITGYLNFISVLKQVRFYPRKVWLAAVVYATAGFAKKVATGSFSFFISIDEKSKILSLVFL
jgi:hypothetical protein